MGSDGLPLPFQIGEACFPRAVHVSCLFTFGSTPLRGRVHYECRMSNLSRRLDSMRKPDLLSGIHEALEKGRQNPTKLAPKPLVIVHKPMRLGHRRLITQKNNQSDSVFPSWVTRPVSLNARPGYFLLEKTKQDAGLTFTFRGIRSFYRPQP